MSSEIRITERTTAQIEVSKHRLAELAYGGKLPNDVAIDVEVGCDPNDDTVVITFLIKADRPRPADILTRGPRNGMDR